MTWQGWECWDLSLLIYPGSLTLLVSGGMKALRWLYSLNARRERSAVLVSHSETWRGVH